MPYAVKITWSSGKSEEFRGEGEKEAFMLSFFGGSGGPPADVVVTDIPEDPPPQAKCPPPKTSEDPPPQAKPKVEAKEAKR